MYWQKKAHGEIDGDYCVIITRDILELDIHKAKRHFEITISYSLMLFKYFLQS